MKKVEAVIRPDRLQAVQDALDTLGTSGLSASPAQGVLNRLIDTQAYTISADDLFRVSAVIFVGLTLLVWLSHPVRAPAEAGAGGGAH